MAAYDIQKIAANIRRLNASEDAQRAARRTRAQEIGAAVAEAIGADDPEVVRVWGFGSTWEPWRTFRMDSDVDIGLEGGDWSRAVSCLYRLGIEREFQVSLVSLDEQPISFTVMQSCSLLPSSNKKKHRPLRPRPSA